MARLSRLLSLVASAADLIVFTSHSPRFVSFLHVALCDRRDLDLAVRGVEDVVLVEHSAA